MKGKPRNTGRIVSDAEFRRMWEDMSISQNEIGRRLGISSEAVRFRAASRKLPPRPRARPFARTVDYQRVVRLYKAGLSQSAVAAVVGVPITSIKAALVEAGVEIRGRHPGASLSVKDAMARVMAMEARETAEALRLSDMVDYHMGNKRRAA